MALTSADEVNMMACEVAYTLFRTPTKIARIRSAEYTSRPELFSEEEALSVDVFISPEQLVTEYIEKLIKNPGALQVLDFADGKVRLVSVRAKKDGLLVRRALREIRDHLPKSDARVVAIYRAGRSIQPQGDTVIEEGDEVFFLARKRGPAPGNERAAQGGQPRQARRDRRRRQHRLPAREDAGESRTR